MVAKPKPRDDKTSTEHEIWVKFDAEIQKGIDDANAGRVKDADEVFDRLEAKYRAMSQHRR